MVHVSSATMDLTWPFHLCSNVFNRRITNTSPDYSELPGWICADIAQISKQRVCVHLLYTPLQERLIVVRYLPEFGLNDKHIRLRFQTTVFWAWRFDRICISIGFRNMIIVQAPKLSFNSHEDLRVNHSPCVWQRFPPDELKNVGSVSGLLPRLLSNCQPSDQTPMIHKLPNIPLTDSLDFQGLILFYMNIFQLRQFGGFIGWASASRGHR